LDGESYGGGSNRGGGECRGPTGGEIRVQQRGEHHVWGPHRVLSRERHHPGRHPNALQREETRGHPRRQQPPDQHHEAARGGAQRGCEGAVPVQVQQRDGALGPGSALQDKKGGHAVRHRHDDVWGFFEVSANPGGE